MAQGKKEQTKRGGGTAKAVFAVILAAAVAVGGATAGWYAHENNWFGLAGADTLEASAQDSGGLLVSRSLENGVSVAMARTSAAANAAKAKTTAKTTAATLSDADTPQAEATYTLTATVEPAIVQDSVKFDWAIAFDDPASDWADGKTVTDYVTVTPESDGAATATVACLEAFAEPMTITCTVRGYALTATCSVDYKQRAGIELWFEKHDYTSGEAVVSEVAIPAGEDLDIPMKWTGGVGNPTYGVAAFPKSKIGYKLCGKMVLSETYTIGVAEEGGAKLAVNLNAEGGDREYFTDSIGSTARHLASFLNIDLSNPTAVRGYSLTPPQSYDTPKDEYKLVGGVPAGFRGDYSGIWLTFDIGMLTFAGAWTNSITGDFYYGSLGQQTGDRPKVETEYNAFLQYNDT